MRGSYGNLSLPQRRSHPKGRALQNRLVTLDLDIAIISIHLYDIIRDWCQTSCWVQRTVCPLLDDRSRNSTAPSVILCFCCCTFMVLVNNRLWGAKARNAPSMTIDCLVVLGLLLCTLIIPAIIRYLYPLSIEYKWRNAPYLGLPRRGSR